MHKAVTLLIINTMKKSVCLFFPSIFSPVKLNSIKQQDPSKQESSHQEPAEKELTQQNHFKQTSSEQESSPHQHETSEEAKDLIYENAAATEMINSSLKRKNSDKLDTICPGAKKHKRKKGK